MNTKTRLKFLLAAVILATNAITGQAFASNFIVNANANSVSGGACLNTGIIVPTGKLLVMSVDKQDLWTFGPAPRTGNANGLSNPFGGFFGNFTKPGTNFSFLFGSLVGTLDGGLTFFPIGTHMEQTILKSTGIPLRLCAWDSDNANNVGSVTVNVEVYTGP
jgi:hypothetical protein